MRIPHLFLLLLVIAIWGSNFSAIKLGLQGIPPIFFCFARFFLCLPALLFVKRPKVPMYQVAIYSFVMFVLQFSLLFSAMRIGITASLASVLLQLQSYFAVAFAVMFMKETFEPKQTVGALAAFLGISLVGLHLGDEVNIAGLLLVLAAAIMWAAGSILAKKTQLDGFSLVVWGSLFACPPLLALSLIFEGPEAILNCLQSFSAIQCAVVCYNSVLATLFGFGTWNWLLQKYPLSKVSPFTLLVPIFGMISSALLLGEPLSPWKIEAAGLIVGGIGINFLSSRRPNPLLSQKK